MPRIYWIAFLVCWISIFNLKKHGSMDLDGLFERQN